jgi:hypothetical protein
MRILRQTKNSQGNALMRNKLSHALLVLIATGVLGTSRLPAESRDNSIFHASATYTAIGTAAGCALANGIWGIDKEDADGKPRLQQDPSPFLNAFGWAMIPAGFLTGLTYGWHAGATRYEDGGFNTFTRQFSQITYSVIGGFALFVGIFAISGKQISVWAVNITPSEFSVSVRHRLGS